MMTPQQRVLSLLNVYARIAKGAGNTEEEQLWHELIDYEQNKDKLKEAKE